MKTCPRCSAVLNDSVKRCPDCNYEFETGNSYSAPNYAYAKYCPRCGTGCDANAVFCPKCGMQFQPMIEDKPSFWLKVLAFFVPLFGIINYFVNRLKEPVAAKAYLKMSVISICIGFLLSIISTIIFYATGIFILRDMSSTVYYSMIQAFSLM